MVLELLAYALATTTERKEVLLLWTVKSQEQFFHQSGGELQTLSLTRTCEEEFWALLICLIKKRSILEGSEISSKWRLQECMQQELIIGLEYRTRLLMSFLCANRELLLSAEWLKLGSRRLSVGCNPDLQQNQSILKQILDFISDSWTRRMLNGT